MPLFVQSDYSTSEDYHFSSQETFSLQFTVILKPLIGNVLCVQCNCSQKRCCFPSILEQRNTCFAPYCFRVRNDNLSLEIILFIHSSVFYRSMFCRHTNGKPFIFFMYPKMLINYEVIFILPFLFSLCFEMFLCVPLWEK